MYKIKPMYMYKYTKIQVNSPIPESAKCILGWETMLLCHSYMVYTFWFCPLKRCIQLLESDQSCTPTSFVFVCFYPVFHFTLGNSWNKDSLVIYIQYYASLYAPSHYSFEHRTVAVINKYERFPNVLAQDLA